ncbi:hypothetical protein, partial [Escherichia coli]|uniref:hypothetical protein n=1 Tax=Escherichia coli TaxID=562 RepID=UPI0032DABD9B
VNILSPSFRGLSFSICAKIRDGINFRRYSVVNLQRKLIPSHFRRNIATELFPSRFSVANHDFSCSDIQKI